LVEAKVPIEDRSGVAILFRWVHLTFAIATPPPKAEGLRTLSRAVEMRRGYSTKLRCIRSGCCCLLSRPLHFRREMADEDRTQTSDRRSPGVDKTTTPATEIPQFWRVRNASRTVVPVV